ncbi:MAG: hypothetical protein WC586_11005 [Methanoregula sp.]
MNGSPAPDENELLPLPEHWTKSREAMDGLSVIGGAGGGETLIIPPESDGRWFDDIHPVASRIMERMNKRENIFQDNVMDTPELFQGSRHPGKRKIFCILSNVIYPISGFLRSLKACPCHYGIFLTGTMNFHIDSCTK